MNQEAAICGCPKRGALPPGQIREAGAIPLLLGLLDQVR